MPTLRPYTPTDAPACLVLFDANVPRYFAPRERQDFANYLLHPDRSHDYRVIEHNGDVVACGGLALDNENTAAFCWGMVDSTRHRQGFGSLLSHARLAHARTLGAQRVTLSTSQHTQGFYAGLGFAVTRIVPDGHGPGLDAVEMALELAPR
ncbi:GNAT family N-acetyltransferase [Stenotrophomonas rhizophila]|uniref:GNAT family N-acetyltransferase n=1 Tax=Stenotrophomonas rhizophila TaxID=216778 RepID=UPI001E5D2A14|nr:GNAT family N-acetyltransferase [Stenotrophomonas rhizophila]MCC7635080.1 GNAT family N-acetyltransferase [Stenotrophomonas rhizophila]MCC7665443.1 GNAT family N-acetyltransferase [Stenotrophomonas rhizophila]